YPTVCLNVLDARARWQEPEATITTDRLGRRCLEPTLPSVKDSFVKKPGWSYAWACIARAQMHGRTKGRHRALRHLLPAGFPHVADCVDCLKSRSCEALPVHVAGDERRTR